jgi:hypothetical protein
MVDFIVSSEIFLNTLTAALTVAISIGRTEMKAMSYVYNPGGVFPEDVNARLHIVM